MFKKRLVKLRTDKGLSQYDLAEALGLSRGQISNYELGTRHPDYETLAKIADYFEVSTDYLLVGHDTARQHINDDEALEYLDELHKRPEMKTLFKVSRKVRVGRPISRRETDTCSYADGRPAYAGLETRMLAGD